MMGRPPTTVDVVIVGAGFSGIHALHAMRVRGLSARVIEAGSGVGGTWYWNRYPGARCDVETTDYQFSFDARIVQGWTWSERYARQPEILDYVNYVTDLLDLRRDMQFSTRVTAAEYDEAAARWLVTTDRGEQISARFLVMATGCLSSARVPESPGLESFAGPSYHTGRWPHEEVELHRPPCRRRRHRLVWHPVDPGHRRAGRAPDRVPAHTELQRPGAQPAARSRGRGAR